MSECGMCKAPLNTNSPQVVKYLYRGTQYWFCDKSHFKVFYDGIDRKPVQPDRVNVRCFNCRGWGTVNVDGDPCEMCDGTGNSAD